MSGEEVKARLYLESHWSECRWVSRHRKQDWKFICRNVSFIIIPSIDNYIWESCFCCVVLQMLGLIHNTSKGSIVTKFYTDSWPYFSSLVCEVITPKLSEVSITIALTYPGLIQMYQLLTTVETLGKQVEQGLLLQFSFLFVEEWHYMLFHL